MVSIKIQLNINKYINTAYDDKTNHTVGVGVLMALNPIFKIIVFFFSSIK